MLKITVELISDDAKTEEKIGEVIVIDTGRGTPETGYYTYGISDDRGSLVAGKINHSLADSAWDLIYNILYHSSLVDADYPACAPKFLCYGKVLPDEDAFYAEMERLSGVKEGKSCPKKPAKD